MENYVYPLTDEGEVACAICRLGREIVPEPYYKKGEAFLAGAGHSPYDGNANYICKDHLDPDAIIVEEPNP